MKVEYIKRYKDELIFSDRQLEQISAHHIVDMFMEHNKLEDLPNINLDWIKKWRFKDWSVWYLDELLKYGIRDTGRIKIRKTKKGFVLEMKFNWRSKGFKKTQYLCRRCKKVDVINFELICKKCTKHLKKQRKFMRFWETNSAILKAQPSKEKNES